MSRRRRGSGIIARAYGSSHDSIIKPPFKARTMEQKRSSSTHGISIAKNIARPFLSNVTNWNNYSPCDCQFTRCKHAK